MRHPPALDATPALEAFAVETLQQDPLVARHAAEVVPRLARVVLDTRCLADVARFGGVSVWCLGGGC
jgi:hypothetical protein